MFRTTHTIKQAAAGIALATTIAVLVVPTALAGSALRDGRAPDTRDAAAVAHQAGSTLVDGRSPDKADAARVAQQSLYGAPDGWYGYAVSLTQASRSGVTPLDGRAPDTLDSAIQAHAPVVTIVRSPGFQWGDFGIGVAAALGLVLLAAVSLRVLTTRNRRPVPVVTA